MVCIYHKNCVDGLFGSAVFMCRFGDTERTELHACQYGDPVPVIEPGKRVFIVDFSFSREELLNLSAGREVVVYDHHKTAAEEISDLPFVTFDTDRCGSMIAWNALFPDKPAPDILNYVQDRDLWKWELEDSREVSAALRAMVRTPADALRLLVRSRNSLVSIVPDLAKRGRTVLDYQEAAMEKDLERVRMIAFMDYHVPIVNTAHLISETVGKLAENHPFAVGYFDTADDRVFSLRSRNDGVDVSAIAKRFGGGGHRNAAGFTVALTAIHGHATAVLPVAERGVA